MGYKRLCDFLKQSIEAALGPQTPKAVIVLLDNNLWKDALQLLPENIRYSILVSLVEGIFKQVDNKENAEKQ